MEGGRGEEKEGDGEGKKGMDGDVEAPSGGFIVVCVCFSRSSSRERQARLFWCGQSRREAEGQFRLPTDLPFRRPPFPYLLPYGTEYFTEKSPHFTGSGALPPRLHTVRYASCSLVDKQFTTVVASQVASLEPATERFLSGQKQVKNTPIWTVTSTIPRASHHLLDYPEPYVRMNAFIQTHENHELQYFYESYDYSYLLLKLLFEYTDTNQ